MRGCNYHRFCIIHHSTSIKSIIIFEFLKKGFRSSYQLTRIFTGAIGSTVSLITLAIVATNVILTSSLLANIFYQTFVDVMLTMVASKTRVLAIALVIVEQIRALTSVTRIGSTFINVFFAVASRVPRWTRARVRLEEASISKR